MGTRLPPSCVRKRPTRKWLKHWAAMGSLLAIRPSCGRRLSGLLSRVGRPWSMSLPTPRLSTHASQIWLEKAKNWLAGQVGQSMPKRESTAIAGGRFKLAPQDGQGYVFRDQFLFDGPRRREAP